MPCGEQNSTDSVCRGRLKKANNNNKPAWLKLHLSEITLPYEEITAMKKRGQLPSTINIGKQKLPFLICIMQL